MLQISDKQNWKKKKDAQTGPTAWKKQILGELLEEI